MLEKVIVVVPGKAQGSHQTQLSKLGYEQMIHAGNKLKPYLGTKCYLFASSDVSAVQSAEIISESLRLPFNADHILSLSAMQFPSFNDLYEHLLIMQVDKYDTVIYVADRQFYHFLVYLLVKFTKEYAIIDRLHLGDIAILNIVAKSIQIIRVEH